MYDPRNTLALNVGAELEKHFGEKLYRTVIPRNIRLAEAPSHGIAGASPRQEFEGRAGLSRARRRDAAPTGSPRRAARGNACCADIDGDGTRSLPMTTTQGSRPRPRRAPCRHRSARGARRRCSRCRSIVCSPASTSRARRMDDAALDELAASIREHGVMQPILVRPVDGGRFEIVAGERRWRAAKRAGLTEVPALVKTVPDQSALALALIENIQREDLNPLEQANGDSAPDRRIRPDPRCRGEGGRPLAQRGDQSAAAARAREAGAGIPDGRAARHGPRARAAGVAGGQQTAAGGAGRRAGTVGPRDRAARPPVRASGPRAASAPRARGYRSRAACRRSCRKRSARR